MEVNRANATRLTFLHDGVVSWWHRNIIIIIIIEAEESCLGRRD